MLGAPRLLQTYADFTTRLRRSVTIQTVSITRKHAAAETGMIVNSNFGGSAGTTLNRCGIVSSFVAAWKVCGVHEMFVTSVKPGFFPD